MFASAINFKWYIRPFLGVASSRKLKLRTSKRRTLHFSDESDSASD